MHSCTMKIYELFRRRIYIFQGAWSPTKRLTKDASQSVTMRTYSGFMMIHLRSQTRSKYLHHKAPCYCATPIRCRMDDPCHHMTSLATQCHLFDKTAYIREPVIWLLVSRHDLSQSGPCTEMSIGQPQLVFVISLKAEFMEWWTIHKKCISRWNYFL